MSFGSGLFGALSLDVVDMDFDGDKDAVLLGPSIIKLLENLDEDILSAFVPYDVPIYFRTLIPAPQSRPEIWMEIRMLILSAWLGTIMQESCSTTDQDYSPVGLPSRCPHYQADSKPFMISS